MSDETTEDAPLVEEFTAVTALAFGAEFTRELDAQKTADALAVAAFLMEYAPTLTEQAADGDEEDEADGMPTGPLSTVHCLHDPADTIQAAAVRGEAVGVRIVAGGGDAIGVVLTARDARAFAAGLLNAADEADGSSPLLMFRKPEEVRGDGPPQAG